MKPVKSLEQRRVELIEMLGEEKVVQMEKEFDEYMIYGTRRSQENPAPLTGIFDESAPSPGTIENIRTARDLMQSKSVPKDIFK